VVAGNETEAVGVVEADGKIRFALKDKDTCQSFSVGWLKSKGLFPQPQVFAVCVWGGQGGGRGWMCACVKERRG